VNGATVRHADDILIFLGICLIAYAVYAAAGVPGLVGYAGTICIVLGIFLGWRPTERKL
jgi:membrane-bound ClpP family serine protease